MLQKQERSCHALEATLSQACVRQQELLRYNNYLPKSGAPNGSAFPTASVGIPFFWKKNDLLINCVVTLKAPYSLYFLLYL